VFNLLFILQLFGRCYDVDLNKTPEPEDEEGQN